MSWLARLFRRAKPAPPAEVATVPKSTFDAINDRYRELRARYDVARLTEDNRRHWVNADGLSAAAANMAYIRMPLRNRSRYEYDNGAYCNGIIRTRADDLVGTGPRLQMQGLDLGLNGKIEALFGSWALAARFAEKLHTMDQTRCRDGEAFALFVTNKALAHPVKFDLHLIEADRVADPWGQGMPEYGKLDGVEYDDLGQPIAYSILDHHPGDVGLYMQIKSTRVLARYVLHWYRVDRPGQVRGVPEITSSLAHFPYMRRWTLATLAAAEFAASQAGVLETDGPLDPNTTTAAPFQQIEFDRGMFTELPAGVKLKQIQAEHPNQQYGAFKRELLNEAGRPVRMPTNVVTADSSQHNFSSAKLDHFGYRGALGVDRYFAGLNHCDRVLAEVCAEAIPLGLLPAGTDVLSIKHSWNWPGWPSMDKDQAGQDDLRLKNGTLTLSDYWAQQGEDWKAKMLQRAAELELADKLGIPAPPTPGQPQPELLPPGATAPEPTDEPPGDGPPAKPEPQPPAKRNGKAQPAKGAAQLNGYQGGRA